MDLVDIFPDARRVEDRVPSIRIDTREEDPLRGCVGWTRVKAGAGNYGGEPLGDACAEI